MGFTLEGQMTLREQCEVEAGRVVPEFCDVTKGQGVRSSLNGAGCHLAACRADGCFVHGCAFEVGDEHVEECGLCGGWGWYLVGRLVVGLLKQAV